MGLLRGWDWLCEFLRTLSQVCPVEAEGLLAYRLPHPWPAAPPWESGTPLQLTLSLLIDTQCLMIFFLPVLLPFSGCLFFPAPASRPTVGSRAGSIGGR